MNIIQSAVCLIVAIVAFLVAGEVHAQTATANITLSGRVTAGTCSVNQPTATLVAIKASEIGPTNGAIGSPEDVNLEFSNCQGVGTVDMTFSGIADSTDATVWKNTAAGGPSGIALVLFRGATSTKISRNQTITHSISNTSSQYAIRAQYWRVGTAVVNAGNVGATISVTLAYK